MTIIYLNGEYLAPENAKISILDRGFRFGDGIFETISFYNKRLYQQQTHLNRLNKSLELVQINFDIKKIPEICESLIKQNNYSDGIIRVSITRGEGNRGYMPSGDEKPTIVIESFPPPHVPKKAINLWLSGIQKISPLALPCNAKTSQGLNSTLAKIDAAKHDCFDSILLGDKGQICECSSGNIFWFDENNILHTPSLESGVLPGTIREAVLRLSPFETRKGVYSILSLKNAEEVFITNVAWKILPVAKLFPSRTNYTPSKRTQTLIELLEEDIRKDCSLSKEKN